MIKIFLSTLFLTFAVNSIHAAPLGVLTPDDLVESFRTALRRKVQELGESYIPKYSSNGVIYVAHEKTKCSYEMVDAGRPLATLNLYSQKKSLSNGLEEMLESADYWGCYNEISIRETILVKGTNLTATSFQDFTRGKMPVTLRDNETEKVYRLFDGQATELLSIQQRREGTDLLITYSILGQKALNYQIKKNEIEQRFIFNFPSFTIDYQLPHSRWRSNYGSSYSLESILGKNSSLATYLAPNRTRLSQQDFQQIFSREVVSKHGRLKLVADFLRYHLHGFPSTEVTASVGNNEKILNELRLANIRLLNGTDINLVQNLIQGYIEAIDKGLIIVDDKRPQ